MLGQVFSNQEHQLIKSIEIGDLSMGTENIPVDDRDKAEVLEELDSAPKCRFTTTWVLSYGRLFWIDVAVVGPVPQQTHDDFPLRTGKVKDVGKAISDVVEFLKKQLGG